MNDHPTVALRRCSAYSAVLRPAIEGLLSDLGGIGRFVDPGQSVLLKPNMLTDRPASDAVTTHPEIVRVLIQILKEHGAEPFVADSPANAVKLERVWERTGYSAMCAAENVELVNLEKSGSEKFTVGGYSFSIAKPVLGADVIINIPKVKSHSLTVLTAAVKNMYGVVPGYEKTHLHGMHPTPSDFGKLMATIYSQVKPSLSIADAIHGMAGNGPSAGKLVELGFLAASDDAVALDVVLCRLLKIDVDCVPYLRHILASDGEAGRLDGIKIEGPAPGDMGTPPFELPGTMVVRLIPGWLVKMLWPLIWVRPSISSECTGCGRCVDACPCAALVLENGRALLDGHKCVGCCCCHEICPGEAITMLQSPLLRLVRGGKTP